MIKLSVSCMLLDVVKICSELFSSNVALSTRLREVETRKCDAQAARKVAEVKLSTVHNDDNEVVELRKRQAAYKVSVQGLPTELTRAKAQSVQVTTERLELSRKLGAEAAESDKRLKELAVVRDACNSVEGVVWSIVGQSVEALAVFVNQVGTQLVDRFCTGLENSYAGSQLTFTYTSNHVSGVGVSSVVVQSPASLGGEDGAASATNSSTPVPSRPSNPPTERTCGASKKARK